MTSHIGRNKDVLKNAIQIQLLMKKKEKKETIIKDTICIVDYESFLKNICERVQY